jgi:hypothetical protein
MPGEHTSCSSCSIKYPRAITDAKAVFFRAVNANNVE